MKTRNKETGRWARNVERFGRWAPSYERSLLPRAFLTPLQTATIAAALRETAQPHAILDVGCGTGALLRRLATRFPQAELVGIDAAAGMIRQAQTAVPRGLSLRFLEAPSEELPLPDGSFDLVLSTMSFHHWADQQRGLAEVRRVLAPEGLFVLTDIVLAAWLSRPLAWSGDRFVTQPGLDTMLNAARLRLVRSSSLPKLRFRDTRITLARAVE